MREQVLGYWVMMATQSGLQRWGQRDNVEAPIACKDDALALAARVASASTCDSIYVMTVYDSGRIAMRTICRPARDPSRPADDAHPPGPGFTGMAGF
jgi:hypothetical protein